MNDERSDGRHGCDHVYRHRQITQPAQAPRDGFDEPQPQPRNQQQDHAVKHQPEEQLLAEIEAAHRRQLLIIILDVVIYGLPPAPVVVGGSQVAVPYFVHPSHGEREGQSKPGMPEARRRPATHHHREPEQVGRPESEACDQAIDVGQRGEPVVNPLAQRVANNLAAGFAGSACGGNDV